MKGKLGVGVEQLCLEVAPSILIDFICAHVSERASRAAEREKEWKDKEEEEEEEEVKEEEVVGR